MFHEKAAQMKTPALESLFMWQFVKVSNVFNTLILKQIFWKTKTIFKKLEYRFLVEATKIENTPFPLKAALSEDK